METDSDTVIVVATNDVWLIEYDAGDHFYIGTEAVDIASEIAASATGANTFTRG